MKITLMIANTEKDVNMLSKTHKLTAYNNRLFILSSLGYNMLLLGMKDIIIHYAYQTLITNLKTSTISQQDKIYGKIISSAEN